MNHDRFYRSIPLARKDTEKVTAAHDHLSKKHLTGYISGELQNLQPLHVGTGQLVPPETIGLQDDAPLVKPFHAIQDCLTIPGSALKGPVRSLVEAITFSCVNKTKARLNVERYGECRHRRGSEICLACRMFGAMGYQGQISFGDAPMSKGSSNILYIPAQHEPKLTNERRYYPHGLQDREKLRWPLQAAKVNSRFHFRINYTNLSEAELGLLLIALGQSQPPICLKLGAGKSNGLGAVRFEELQVVWFDLTQLYQAYESQTAVHLVDKAAYIESADALVRRDILTQLQIDLGCDYFKEA